LAYQDAPYPMPASARRMAGMSDEQFANEAAKGGMAEVKLGQLAEERASSPDVKAFGQKMVAEHGKAGEQLKEAAAKAKIALPSELDPKDQATYDRLAKLSGAEFDRAYVQDMVKDHRGDLAVFQREASNGKNEAIRTFALETVPMIQEHFDKAKELWKEVSPTAGKHATRHVAAKQARGQ
jgi:putative membrane protein